MRNINILTFSDALEKAIKNPEHPYLIRFKDAVIENGKVRLDKTSYFWIGKNTAINSLAPCICAHRKHGESLQMEASYNVSVPSNFILATDFLDVDDWGFVNSEGECYA